MSSLKRPPGAAPPRPAAAVPLVTVADDDDDFMPAPKPRPPHKRPPKRAADGASRWGPGRGGGAMKAAVKGTGARDENTAVQEVEGPVLCPVCGLGLGLWPTLQARALHVEACLTRNSGGGATRHPQQQPTAAVSAPACGLEPRGPVRGEAAREQAVPAQALQGHVPHGQAPGCGVPEPIDLCGDDEPDDTRTDDRATGAASPPGMAPAARWRSIPPPVGGAFHGSSGWASPGAWLCEHGPPPVKCCEAAALAAVAATSWAGGAASAFAEDGVYCTPPLLPSAAADAHGAHAAAEAVWLAHQAPAVAPAV